MTASRCLIGLWIACLEFVLFPIIFNFYGEHNNTMMSMSCNFRVTSDAAKALIAQKDELEMRLRKIDQKEFEAQAELIEEIDELKYKINCEHIQWLAANWPHEEKILALPVITLEDLHFFRFGKIDRWKEGQHKNCSLEDYSIEGSDMTRLIECYKELPTDVRLTEADLLAWGVQHLSNEELPTLEDLHTWMSGYRKPQKQLLCNRLVREYIKHFGDRFVINGAVAQAQNGMK